MLLRRAGSAGSDPAARGARPHPLLDRPVPMGRSGPPLRLQGQGGGGPGQGVEPPPCAHDHRVHLLHGAR